MASTSKQEKIGKRPKKPVDEQLATELIKKILDADNADDELRAARKALDLDTYQLYYRIGMYVVKNKNRLFKQQAAATNDGVASTSPAGTEDSTYLTSMVKLLEFVGDDLSTEERKSAAAKLFRRYIMESHS